MLLLAAYGWVPAFAGMTVFSVFKCLRYLSYLEFTLIKDDITSDEQAQKCGVTSIKRA